MQKTQSKNAYSAIPFAAVVFLCAAAMFYLFYQYATNPAWTSDFIVHNNVAGALFNSSEESRLLLQDYQHIYAYPLYHLAVKCVGLLLFGHYEIASALVLLACNVGTILLVRKLLLGMAGGAAPASIRYLIDIVSAGSVFFTGLGGFFSQGKWYAIVGSPNLWHNPTYLMARPLTLLSFYYFMKAFPQLQQGKLPKKDLVLFSVYMAAGCLAKPSFAVVLLPAMGLYTAVYILFDFKTRFLKTGVPLLGTVLPSVAVLLLQYVFVGTKTQALQTAIQFGIGLGGSLQQTMTLLQAAGATLSLLLLPLFVFATVGYKNIRQEPGYTISQLAALAGWAQAYFLYQEVEGIGFNVGDYYWGYLLAVHLASIMAVGLVLKTNPRRWVSAVTIGLYAVQLLQGMRYFGSIVWGGHSFFI